MKKKIFIGIGAVIVIIAGYVAYTLLTTRSHSPAETVTQAVDGVEVKVIYCRPYKKGRQIFGEEGALVPYGKYWRLGANEATEITFGGDVNFAGQPVKAGSYRMYAVPGPNSWEVSLNSALGEWGAFEPDHNLDVLKVSVPARSDNSETEQFTITIEADSVGANMNFMWDKTVATIPVSGNN